LLIESRRRAYLTAMQVVNWLPRTELPFAAPSRPELLQALPRGVRGIGRRGRRARGGGQAKPGAAGGRSAKVEVPRPPGPNPVAEEAARWSRRRRAATTFCPAIAAGRALPAAGGVAHRRTLPDPRPGLLLLKDMLRAAGLPDSPQIIGEPVRWPLLVRGTMDQGPEAARDFVQGFVSARLEDGPACACG
jgi:hypothetical protein